jgi:predicted RNA binding protein YcfA (HicA-like mRNA interferase family)
MFFRLGGKHEIADLLKELIAAGCELRRHRGGSHQIWWSPITGKTFPVPHPKKICLSVLSNRSNWRGFNPRRLGGEYVFSVGVESPKDADTAFSISVPAFDKFDYGCFRCRYQADIAAREAILAIVEEMI